MHLRPRAPGLLLARSLLRIHSAFVTENTWEMPSSRAPCVLSLHSCVDVCVDTFLTKNKGPCGHHALFSRLSHTDTSQMLSPMLAFHALGSQLVDIDGPFITVRLVGRFWHKRVDVLARVQNYVLTRIPEAIELQIEDSSQLDGCLCVFACVCVCLDASVCVFWRVHVGRRWGVQ